MRAWWVNLKASTSASRSAQKDARRGAIISIVVSSAHTAPRSTCRHNKPLTLSNNLNNLRP